MARGGVVRLGVGDLGGSLGVVRLGVGGVRLGVSLSRGGVGGVVRLGVSLNRGGGGGAGGSPRLGGPRLSVVRRRSNGRALSGGTDEVLTTSLHDTGEGRAGNKGQEGDGVDHFERLKSLL